MWFDAFCIYKKQIIKQFEWNAIAHEFYISALIRIFPEYRKSYTVWLNIYIRTHSLAWGSLSWTWTLLFILHGLLFAFILMCCCWIVLDFCLTCCTSGMLALSCINTTEQKYLINLNFGTKYFICFGRFVWGDWSFFEYFRSASHTRIKK